MRRLVSLLFTLISCLITSTAFAAPETVRMEVIGLGTASGDFTLPLNSVLSANTAYKIKIQARDIDGDNNAQPVNNITFDIAITNGTLTGFEWLVTGDIDDENPNNSVPGIDNLGQVSTDTFSGHSVPTQTLINAGFAVPLPLAVIYFTTAASGTVNVNVDSNPYVSGFATDNSHYGVNGNSYRINQGLGLAFSATIGGVNPTFTATRTATRTNTPVIAATFTATATRTATRTNTPIGPTATSTRTPTRTNTPAITNTFTATPTRTRTPTFTPTRTSTPIVSSTPTRTPTRTSTRTPTRTSTPASQSRLSGVVTSNGLALNGVLVEDATLGYRLTDFAGRFDFGGVADGTLYALTLTKPGYVISPSSSCGTVVGATSLNFTALPAGKLYPILECVKNNGNGTYTAHYGYHNTGAALINVPISGNNRFTSGEKDRGQDTVFLPGRAIDSFTVNFTGAELVWKLKKTSVAASSASPVCCAAGVFDQCGVCGGDGSTCNSCGEGAGASIANDLAFITEGQLDLVQKIQKKSRRDKNLTMPVKQRVEKAAALSSSNLNLLTSISELLAQCTDLGNCGAEMCELATQYKVNSQQLKGAALKLERLLKSSRVVNLSSAEFGGAALGLHKENLKRMEALLAGKCDGV